MRITSNRKGSDLEFLPDFPNQNLLARVQELVKDMGKGEYPYTFVKYTQHLDLYREIE